jgi:hypothetical protein
MGGFGGEQQQIARITDKGAIALENLALPFDSQIEDETLHAVRAIDKKVQRAAGDDRRESSNQISIEQITWQ